MKYDKLDLHDVRELLKEKGRQVGDMSFMPESTIRMCNEIYHLGRRIEAILAERSWKD